MRKSKVRFIIALLIPLIIGVISALLTRNNMALYQYIEKPPLSPPSIVFPIAWTILYLMMGAASYLATTTPGKAYAIFIADICVLSTKIPKNQKENSLFSEEEFPSFRRTLLAGYLFRQLCASCTEIMSNRSTLMIRSGTLEKGRFALRMSRDFRGINGAKPAPFIPRFP